MKSRSAAFAVVNAALIAAVIVVNVLAITLPLNGRSTASISDSFASLFVPANYVFSIWGLIYLCLIAFGVFQLLPGQRDNLFVSATDWWFALSCLANASWLFAWHYGLYPLSVFVMLVLLLALIIIYAGIHPSGRDRDSPDLATRALVRLPFSIYLGWITVAATANISDVLSWTGFAGLGAPNSPWTAALCVLTGLVALLMGILYRDVAYAAVIIWALVGIIQKQAAHPLIVSAGWTGVGVAAAGVVAGTLARRRTPQRT
ncbi:MAG TPA: tryptophan-rich sensory protein [Spirochaetia bacterium]|nr:tryptophan-rich sensory protein [Spirochaetia bacterium]